MYILYLEFIFLLHILLPFQTKIVVYFYGHFHSHPFNLSLIFTSLLLKHYKIN